MGKVLSINKKKTYYGEWVDMRAEIMAKKVFELYNTSLHPIIDLEKILEDEKIEAYNVDFSDISDHILGAIRKDEKGEYEILLNKDLEYIKKRITLAHELGHYYLKHLDGSKNELIDVKLNVDLDIDDELEKEAGIFAEALLINEDLLRMYFRMLKRSTNSLDEIMDKLATIFGVYKVNIKNRLMKLGLV